MNNHKDSIEMLSVFENDLQVVLMFGVIHVFSKFMPYGQWPDGTVWHKIEARI
jgi:hypothetical protein